MQNAAQQPGQDRYRVLLSDGEYQYSGMVATQLTFMVTDGQFKEGSIVRVTDYLCNPVQDKK